MSADSTTSRVTGDPLGERFVSLLMVGFFVAFAGLCIALVWLGVTYPDRAETAVADKYDVAVSAPADPSTPGLWTVDGAERQCAYENKPVTLKCLDADGTYVEVGR